MLPLCLLADDVFIECTTYSDINKEPQPISFHIKLDEQLVKSRNEYVKYTQGTNGVITWQEITNYDDGTWIANAYFIDRVNLVLDIVTEYSYKSHDSKKYYCLVKDTKF